MMLLEVRTEEIVRDYVVDELMVIEKTLGGEAIKARAVAENPNTEPFMVAKHAERADTFTAAERMVKVRRHLLERDKPGMTKDVAERKMREAVTYLMRATQALTNNNESEWAGKWRSLIHQANELSGITSKKAP